MAYIEKFPITVENPDGEVLELFTSGDEFSNYIHDEYDNKIMQGDDGYYYYAYQYKEEIFPGRIKVNKNKYKGKVHKKEISDSDEQYKRRANRMNLPEDYSFEKKSLSEPTFSQYNTLSNSLENNSIHLGRLNNIVIFIRFSDDDNNWVYGLSHYNELLNGNKPSVRDYFNEVSYGKVDVISHMYPKSNNGMILSYQDIHERNYYLPYSSRNTIGYKSTERAQREHDLLMRAINSISHEIPESLEIDGDYDDKVDSVTFICKGNATGWGSILWGHRWVLYKNNVKINNKRVWDFTFQPENQAIWNIISHELFHVFGAPDLYRYSNRIIRPVGSWDLMSSGRGHMTTHMKYKYTNQNWVTNIPVITQPGRYTIKSTLNENNNVYRINSNIKNNEYFIIEFRNKKHGTYENYLPQSGLIIYRIYDGINTGNRNGPPDELYIFRDNGTPTTNGNISLAAYNQNYNKTKIDNTTNPRIHFTDNSEVDVIISDIHIDFNNDQASFNYNYDGNSNEYTISLSTNPPNIANLSGSGTYLEGTIVNISVES